MSKKQKQILLLTVMFFISLYFWNSILLYPIKLFVVFLHEISHGIAALILGGKILGIQIDYRVGGYCIYTVPPGKLSQILVAGAGYLGSMFWGGLILILASKMDRDKIISFVIGIFMLVLGFFVIKTGQIFGIVFTFGFAAFILLSCKFFTNLFHDYMLKFIGLTSCLYVIMDIKSDLIDNIGLGSDADMIASITGIPPIIIGLAWALIALFMLYFILKHSFNVKESDKSITKSF